jgi:hypothetical protein
MSAPDLGFEVYQIVMAGQKRVFALDDPAIHVLATKKDVDARH